MSQRNRDRELTSRDPREGNFLWGYWKQERVSIRTKRRGNQKVFRGSSRYWRQLYKFWWNELKKEIVMKERQKSHVQTTTLKYVSR